MLQEVTLFVPKAVHYVVVHKDVIISLLGGAAGVSIFAQGILHKLNDKLNAISPTKRKIYSYVLAQALTAIAALAAYVIGNVDLTQVYPWLAALVTAVHQLAVNPLYTKKVLPFLEFQAGLKADATPSESVPVNTPQAAGVSFVS